MWGQIGKKQRWLLLFSRVGWGQLSYFDGMFQKVRRCASAAGCSTCHIQAGVASLALPASSLGGQMPPPSARRGLAARPARPLFLAHAVCCCSTISPS